MRYPRIYNNEHRGNCYVITTMYIPYPLNNLLQLQKALSNVFIWEDRVFTVLHLRVLRLPVSFCCDYANN